jgi:hypothetical protein
MSLNDWSSNLFFRHELAVCGLRMNKKAETIRDRLVSRDEEKRPLGAAFGVVTTAPHQYVGGCCTTTSSARWSGGSEVPLGERATRA